MTRPNLQVDVLRRGHGVSQVLISAMDHSAPYASKACRIDGVGTAEAERRKGIGRYAMEVALSEMRRRGFRHVVLEVLSENYPAQLMYYSMGFRKLSSTYCGKKVLQ